MDASITPILDYFDQINAIPRCSKSEQRIREWLSRWAAERNLETNGDAAGNLVVQVPASAGCEQAPTIVIQGHMDMVCEKTPDASHDFTQDPIRSHMEGEWLTADKTTLGADNGIAIAYALALAEDRDVIHPPLELLFTVDEESGLTGVKQMDPGLIKGRRLINLDSEDEGIFTIGCAGGEDTRLTMTLQPEPLPADFACMRLVVGGLRGGHSGIDIHKQRANANRLLARTLDQIQRKTACRLVHLTGGSRHNAIARDAAAVFAIESGANGTVAQLVGEMEATLKQEVGGKEPDLLVRVQDDPPSIVSSALSLADSRRAVSLLLALPHGVAGMSTTVDGLVETSCNLATTALDNGRLSILTSQRSASPSRLAEMTAMIEAVGSLAGATSHGGSHYPPWQPDLDSQLLQASKTVYATLFGRQPVIQIIHAGLECAIIGDLCPGMQMISFGPTIRNPHSPDERLLVPSVGKVWQLLVALLASLSGR